MLTKQELDTQSYHRVSDPVKNWSEKYYQERELKESCTQYRTGLAEVGNKKWCMRDVQRHQNNCQDTIWETGIVVSIKTITRSTGMDYNAADQEKLHSSAEVKFLLKLHFCLKYAKENLKKDFESQSLSSGKTLWCFLNHSWNHSWSENRALWSQRCWFV